MSRRVARLFLALAGVLFLSVPLGAQERIELPIVAPPPQATAEDVIAAAEQAYGPSDLKPKPRCPPPRPGDEIVVCAPENEDPAKAGFDKARAAADFAAATMNRGAPRAPDLETKYPGQVVARGCFIPPCPPPMAKIIDLKAIPEAPPGSDADRIAHGLAPIGGGEVGAAGGTAAASSATTRGTQPLNPQTNAAKAAMPRGSASPAVGP